MKKFFLKNNFQVIYGIVLIILVPVVVATNTLLLNSSFKKTIDIQLQRNALSVGQILNSTLSNSLADAAELQRVVNEVVQNSADVVLVEILEPQTGEFQIIASSASERVATQSSYVQYILSWQQRQAVATVLDQAQQSAVFQIKGGGLMLPDRVWLVTVPLKNQSGDFQYLLSVALSLKVVDQLVMATVKNSTWILVFSILFLLLLLAANARLFEYAVLYRKIKEVDQMKDEFISIASHELRTPLTAINGYVELLLEAGTDSVNAEVRKSLNIIKRSAVRLGDLVEDLLNVSRIEQGRMQFEIKKQNPLPSINEVIEQLSPAAREKNLALIFSPPEKCPEINIDQERFKQVLVNIVGNAIKYTARGRVTVKIETDDKYFCLRVIDTGVGMSAAERERLFEKFYRIRTPDTREIPGTGLGLWLTKQLVENMTGKIYIDSIKGQGTDVSIRFPKA